ncbi:MAG: hypothetical protein LCH85_13030 [Chloroflexi bacterium]|nr:hypothetical protein [Chloroflexota bacterium]
MYSVPTNQTKLPAPLGLKLVGVRYGLGSLLLAVLTVLLGSRLQTWFGSDFFIPLLQLLLYAGMTILYAIITWGIFKQRERVRRLGVFIECVSLAFSAFALLTGDFEASDWFSAGLSIVIIWYLRRTETLDYFYGA